MNQLPYICGINPHMQHVYDQYVEAFNRVSSMPRIETLEQEAAFCTDLRSMLENARSVLPRMARASKEISRYLDSAKLNKFIDDFLVRCVQGSGPAGLWSAAGCTTVAHVAHRPRRSAAASLPPSAASADASWPSSTWRCTSSTTTRTNTMPATLAP